MRKPLSILVGVHGRFHAFDLAAALGQLGGVNVHIATNYPRSVVSRWVQPAELSTFVAHGVLTRFIARLGTRSQSILEPALHRSFGRFVQKTIKRGREEHDLAHVFTGVAEECLQGHKSQTVRTIMRGSAHIDEQCRLLEEEALRIGEPIEQPSRWMVAREKREYALADRVIVLSEFAFKSFINRGFDPKKLLIIPLGVNTEQFLANKGTRDARIQRVREGEKLRILMTGTFSAQKGAMDFLHVAERLSHRMQFTVVGNITPDAMEIVRAAEGLIEFKPRVPQSSLPQVYSQYDVFLFPTIHDGFAAVLAQAYAAGLAVIATENCGAFEVLRGSPRGWIVPIRSAHAICSRLSWLDGNRERMANLLARDSAVATRGWSNVAMEYLSLAEECRRQKAK